MANIFGKQKVFNGLLDSDGVYAVSSNETRVEGFTVANSSGSDVWLLFFDEDSDEVVWEGSTGLSQPKLIFPVPGESVYHHDYLLEFTKGVTVAVSSASDYITGSVNDIFFQVVYR